MAPLLGRQPAGEKHITPGDEAELSHHRPWRDAQLMRDAIRNEIYPRIVTFVEIAAQIFRDDRNPVRVADEDIFRKTKAETRGETPFVALVVKSMNGDDGFLSEQTGRKR